MLDDIFTNVKNWFKGTSTKGFNVKVSQNDLRNLSAGKIISFNNLPEIIYSSLIGKSIDMNRLQFEVKVEIQYNEDGFRYKEFKLEEIEGLEFWLEVMKDLGTWDISIWKRMPYIPQDVYMKNGQILQTVVIENKTYTQDMNGSADFRVMDEENPQRGNIRYWRFQCKDDPSKLFAVSDWTDVYGVYDCALGEIIKEKDFEIIILKASFS